MISEDKLRRIIREELAHVQAVQIAALNIKPGDVVIILAKEYITMEAAAKLRHAWGEILPTGATVALLDPTFTLEGVLRGGHADKLLEQLPPTRVARA